MDEPTRRALRAVNRRFYDRYAREFSGSRQRPWPGWERLAGHLETGSTPAVLDVGCGNGRFGLFLAGRRAESLRYVGIDSCAALLRIAARRLAVLGPDLRHLDVLEGDLGPALDGRRFDLVALLGVLHHVPGAAARRQLLRRLAARLNPGGLLAISVWRLDRSDHFVRKVVAWEGYNLLRAREGRPPIDLERLEDGDVLLGWGGSARHPRYCHFPDSPEIQTWIDAVSLRLVDRFDADGPSARDNHYLVFRRAGAGAARQGCLTPPC